MVRKSMQMPNKDSLIRQDKHLIMLGMCSFSGASYAPRLKPQACSKCNQE